MTPEISSRCDGEAMIYHIFPNPCLVDPNDCPVILDVEDTPGLAIYLPVGQKNGDLITHRVCPRGFASNGSNGYFIWLDRANTVTFLD